MNQNDNSTQFLENNPSLKLRYSRGLGDAIAALLHGKTIGWLTHLITGKKVPCSTCSKRREALNILFPIPFWRLFFKTKQDVTAALTKEMEAAGFDSAISKNKENVSFTKTEEEIVESEIEVYNETRNATRYDRSLDNYKILSSTDSVVGNNMIRIQIYEKI